MNDKIRTIKPDFKNVRINETHHYPKHIQEKFGNIYSIHLFDKNENTYCCSLTPSYCLHYLGTVVEFKNSDDCENPDLVNLRDELETESGHELVNYYDCNHIDKLPAEDIDDCEIYDNSEWGTEKEYNNLLEDVIDSSRGNPSW
jgi:hypothetical protein